MNDEQAFSEFNKAIAILEPIAKAAPADAMALRSLAASYNNLASLEDVAKPQAAAEAYRKAIAIERNLVKADPLNRFHQRELALTYNNLGMLCRLVAGLEKRGAMLRGCY